MTHEYSKFKNKNIPYAKVGRRVFNSLFDAETFCTEHGLDVNSAIEYRDDPELKNNIQTIAQYQKAILQECLDRLKARAEALVQEINRCNAEGYHDPTAYHGTKNIIRDEDEQQKRVNTLIFVLKYITRLAGFELLNRIEIKDRKTGREYK